MKICQSDLKTTTYQHGCIFVLFYMYIVAVYLLLSICIFIQIAMTKSKIDKAIWYLNHRSSQHYPKVHGDPCDPSLGTLVDISPAQVYCANFNSTVFFLPTFIVIYSLNETYIFFILVFSYPILLCLFLSSNSSLSVFLLCLSLSILYFLFSPLSLSLSVFYFLPLLVFCYIFLTTFFFFSCMCFIIIITIIVFLIIIILLLQFLFSIFYLSISSYLFLLLLLSVSFSFAFLTLFFFLLSLITLF